MDGCQCQLKDVDFDSSQGYGFLLTVVLPPSRWVMPWKSRTLI
jgi:hypothetical protein